MRTFARLVLIAAALIVSTIAAASQDPVDAATGDMPKSSKATNCGRTLDDPLKSDDNVLRGRLLNFVREDKRKYEALQGLDCALEELSQLGRAVADVGAKIEQANKNPPHVDVHVSPPTVLHDTDPGLKEAIRALANATTQLARISGEHGGQDIAITRPTRIALPDRIVVSEERGEPPKLTQIDPTKAIAESFRDSGRIALGIVFVPDPRVPRHRRAYDITISAVSSGMLDAGYVLDRFAFPWQTRSRANTQFDPDTTKREHEDASEADTSFADDGRFGVLVFRKDCWRANGNDATCESETSQLVVLYAVPETASYGVPQTSFVNALKCANAQVNIGTLNLQGQDKGNALCQAPKAAKDPINEPRVLWLHASSGSVTTPKCEKMVMIGTHFSGSLDSVARALARDDVLGPGHKPGICLLSTSGTAANNAQLSQYGVARPQADTSGNLAFHSLAVDDKKKYELLKEFAEDAFGLDTQGSRVVLLCEETTFGSGVCESGRGAQDQRTRILFPSNIADIRYSRQLHESKMREKAPTDSLSFSSHLHLDEGAENGNEFPDSQQSLLTSAGSELKLDAILETLRELDPELVVVAATDVRDRLFLFDVIGRELPGALLVDLEADVLLSHPDFTHANRGVLMLSSAQLTDFKRGSQSYTRSYATDYEALTIRAMRTLASQDADSSIEASSNPGHPFFYVAARGGPQPMKSEWGGSPSGASFEPSEDDRRSWTTIARQGPWIAPLLLCVALAWILSRRPEWKSGEWPARAIARESLPPIAIAICASLLSSPEGFESALERTVVCLVMFAPLLLIHRAKSRAHESQRSKRGGEGHQMPIDRWFIVIAIAACAFGALFVLYGSVAWGRYLARYPDDINLHRAIQFAMRFNEGIGLLPAFALTALTVLFGSVSVYVGVSTMRRNIVVVMKTFEERLSHIGAKSLLIPVAVMSVAGLVCAISSAMPPKLTVFGSASAWAMVFAEVALSLFSITFLLAAILFFRRLQVFVSALTWMRVAFRPSTAKQNESANIDAKCKCEPVGEGKPDWSNFWSDRDTPPPELFGTPFAASLQPLIEHRRHVRLLDESLSAVEGQALLLREWAQHADTEARGTQQGETVDGEAAILEVARRAERRWAVFRLFATELSGLRWAVLSALLTTLAIVCLAYAYPMPGGDAFVVLNLAVMFVAGVFAAYAVVSLERVDLLSRVLCDTSAKTEFSGTYFCYLLTPIAIFTVAVLLIEVPGVISWGNGLMSLYRMLVDGH